MKRDLTTRDNSERPPSFFLLEETFIFSVDSIKTILPMNVDIDSLISFAR